MVGRAGWTVTIRPGCGEMVAIRTQGPRDPDLVLPTESADPERSRREAARRASAKVRRLVVEHDLTRMWSLTCDGEHATDEWLRIRELVRRLAERLREEGVTRWVAVPELHPGGHGWHVHLLVGRWLPKALVRRCWPYGFVDGRKFRAKGGGRAGARAAAGYAAKYTAKTADIDTVPRGAHRYWRAEGMAVLELHAECDWPDVIRLLALWRGEEPIVWEWASSQEDDWQGPPVHLWRW